MYKLSKVKFVCVCVKFNNIYECYTHSQPEWMFPKVLTKIIFQLMCLFWLFLLNFAMQCVPKYTKKANTDLADNPSKTNTESLVKTPYSSFWKFLVIPFDCAIKIWKVCRLSFPTGCIDIPKLVPCIMYRMNHAIHYNYLSSLK